MTTVIVAPAATAVIAIGVAEPPGAIAAVVAALVRLMALARALVACESAKAAVLRVMAALWAEMCRIAAAEALLLRLQWREAARPARQARIVHC